MPAPLRAAWEKRKMRRNNAPETTLDPRGDGQLVNGSDGL